MKKKFLSRRDFLLLGAGAASGAVLAACAPSEPQVVEVEKIVEKIVTVEVEKEVMVEPEAQKNAFGYVEWHSDEPVELVWWGHNIKDANGPGAADRHTLDGFYAMYPNIRMKIIPSSWFAGITPLEKLAAAFAAGVDTPDIFTTHGASDQAVKNGWMGPVIEDMMPVEDRERLGYVQMRLLQTQGDDRVTELVSLAHHPVLFYDAALFEEKGMSPDDLGTYFEDAIPALQELTEVDTDGTVVRAGWNMWGWLWPNMPIQAGAEYFDKEAQKLNWVDDEAFMYAVQFFRDLSQKYKVTSADIMFQPTQGIPDGISATTFNDTWMRRFYNVNRPDTTARSRPGLLLKNQAGGPQLKGHLSKQYGSGIGLAANIEDPVRARAALEFWKYSYYNTANQNDYGWENVGLVLLNNKPDYEGLMERVPETGPIPNQDATGEALYVANKDLGDRSEWADLGQLREQYPIFMAMMQEVAGTDTPLKEIVENYQAQCQADWEENVWYVPDVVAV